MRLWHYKLLPYLPRLQLTSQWRECCCIAKSIAEKGTPNHVLVNRIMDYPIGDFVEYCTLVCIEMEYRGYRCDFSRLDRIIEKWDYVVPLRTDDSQMFQDWHNDIYLRECLYNLEEKAISKAIPADEWRAIYDRFKDFTPLLEGK